jgi:hypothetical protein
LLRQRVQSADGRSLCRVAQLRAESQSQAPGTDFRESSENLKGKKRCCGASSNRMLSLCATVVEVGPGVLRCRMDAPQEGKLGRSLGSECQSVTLTHDRPQRGSPPSQRKATLQQLIEYCFPNVLTVQNCSLFDNNLRSSRILPLFKFLHSSTDLRSTNLE